VKHILQKGHITLIILWVDLMRCLKILFCIMVCRHFNYIWYCFKYQVYSQ